MKMLKKMLSLGLLMTLVVMFTACDEIGSVEGDAYYPNTADNRWQYQESGNSNDTQTWQIDNDDYTTAGQSLYVHGDSDDDDDYLEMNIVDNQNSLEARGMYHYNNGVMGEYSTFDSTPWVLVKWGSDGLRVGDTWQSFHASGLNNGFWGFSGFFCDTIGFKLTAEVKGTVTYDYKGTSLTAYHIEHSGSVYFEVGGMDPIDWNLKPYKYDIYFVPRLGYVKTVTYSANWDGSLYPDVTIDLIDTNVPLP